LLTALGKYLIIVPLQEQGFLNGCETFSGSAFKPPEQVTVKIGGEKAKKSSPLAKLLAKSIHSAGSKAPGAVAQLIK
jgi:hypothetical protein